MFKLYLLIFFILVVVFLLLFKKQLFEKFNLKCFGDCNIDAECADGFKCIKNKCCFD